MYGDTWLKAMAQDWRMLITFLMSPYTYDPTTNVTLHIWSNYSCHPTHMIQLLHLETDDTVHFYEHFNEQYSTVYYKKSLKKS